MTPSSRLGYQLAAALTATGLLAVPACGNTSKSTRLAAASPTTMVRKLTPAVTGQLDQAVGRVLHQAGVPGVLVGLWIPGNGSYVRSFGVADKSTKTPMSTGLNMRIGSETKTFTVTALLQLADQGKVALDDPISKYLPGVPRGDQITLRQLADMRSGLYSYTSDPDFQNAFFAAPTQEFTPQQLLGYSFKHPPVFPPGTKFQYSNTNAVLLGLVVEKVSGQSLAGYLQQHILTPSHLGHTLFPSSAEFPAPHAHGYTDQTPNGQVADATEWNPSWGWAAGAMISNLTDLQAWGPILAMGTLLKPATQAQRLRTLPTGMPGTGYGLGVFYVNGWIGHNGSLPGYQSLTVYLPPVKATLVILANTDIGYHGSEVSTLFGRAVTGIVTPGNVYTLHS